MKTSSQQIQAAPGNQFFLEFFLGLQKEFRAIRADGVKFLILDDLHAIRRENPRFINVLDSTAVDSSVLLGQTYVPPASFVSMDFSVQPLRFLLLDGYRNIEVRIPFDYSDVVRIRNRTVDTFESRLTRVVITLDLDASLTRRADYYEFRPVFSISSITVR